MPVIVGAETQIGAAILKRYRAAGQATTAVVRSAYAADTQGAASQSPESGSRIWDPRSPLAARSLVMELTVAEPLDLCIVIEDPAVALPQRLHEAHLFEIDRVIDEHVKSYLFLLRELLRHRAEIKQLSGDANRRGQVAVVRTLVAGSASTTPPLNACAAAAFGGLMNALANSVDTSGPGLVLFEPAPARSGEEVLNDAPVRTAYAEFVFDTLEVGASGGNARHRFRPGRRRLPLF